MNKTIINRADRYISHALVELKKYKNLPFGAHSAILLDISLSGFKIEFTGDTKVKPGEFYWLQIPLAPLGIMAPSKFECKTEVKWFDENKFRVGGTFNKLKESEKVIIDQIFEQLRSKGVVNL